MTMSHLTAREVTAIIDRSAEQWSPEQLHETFLTHGCAVIRQAIPSPMLEKVRLAVAHAYEQNSDPLHVYDPEIAEASRGELTGFETVDTPLLQEFLRLAFRNQAYRRHSVSARRISASESKTAWQKPLQLHLDCQVHAFQFTVNFWIPFQSCGVDAPALKLLPVDHRTTRAYSGFTGERMREGENWNEGYFPLGKFTPEAVTHAFGHDAFIHPVMNPGDAIVSSNWLIHSSHATPEMQDGRSSIEVRFIGSKLDPAKPRLWSRLKRRLASA